MGGSAGTVDAMIQATYLVMRYAPLIGRRDGRRIVTVVARTIALEHAIIRAQHLRAFFRSGPRGTCWIVKAGMPAHRRPRR